MAANSFSAMLRELVDDTQANLMSYEEYRRRRRILLDQIDEEYNGVTPNSKLHSDSTLRADIDDQAPHYDEGFTDPDSMQTIVFSPYDKSRE